MHVYNIHLFFFIRYSTFCIESTDILCKIVMALMSERMPLQCDNMYVQEKCKQK